ncbi:MAG: hypothetical protein AUJ02_01335 [Chloroflexi bacterium 13_1_40CM_3_65_12]|nr:MAG: hypothetical protein AUH40_00140 [Chloroflexi bacterium 13_1_40CM_65_17]OLC63736.1 MAG: hypothetical protein AUH69_13695 [Actinobacteria bacterium 13_1_40CM_4_65_12]OLD26822.1 MAG: hypothetical protein AUJ02_01335 [Chloroflexi bacterium 13_1_40CM_3_65_12]
MANFLLVYTGGGMPATDTERKKVMDDWGAWFSKLGPAVVDPGNPISHAKNISSDGSVHEGAVGMTASGYSVLKADSLDKAVALAKSCPVLKSGAKISVYETIQAM